MAPYIGRLKASNCPNSTGHHKIPAELRADVKSTGARPRKKTGGGMSHLQADSHPKLPGLITPHMPAKSPSSIQRISLRKSGKLMQPSLPRLSMKLTSSSRC